MVQEAIIIIINKNNKNHKIATTAVGDWGTHCPRACLPVLRFAALRIARTVARRRAALAKHSTLHFGITVRPFFPRQPPSHLTGRFS